ncbi:MAG TPA: DUF1338 domain-containing protein [Puia sp.]|nr:DUF1338 domain-containing protein [Puia sp.]
MPVQATLEFVLEGLMRRYRERVPDVQAILDAMHTERIIHDPSEIENDHIAFRSLGIPNLGIASLEKIFLHLGYAKRDYYYFPEKKLDAYWYAPPSDHYPRIFLSQLRVQDLSPATRQIIARYTQPVTTDPTDVLDLSSGTAVDQFLHSSLWPLPTIADFEALGAESEYAAWVIYNRYYLNHFTISVHNLPSGYNTIADFNVFLERKEFTLNNAGGKIKQSPDGLLLQSATIAKMIEATFANGEKKPIAGSYVEFAERRVLPQFAGLPVSAIRRIHRREGFEAANADKIFESTYSSQTQKE